MQSLRRPLRILCVEDNPLLVMQLEMVIEELGHVFAGSATRFSDVRSAFDQLDFDVALVDIDLADGRTGGEITEWLEVRGKPSLFITGQEQLAGTYQHSSLGTIIKPVSEETLRVTLRKIAASIDQQR